MVVSRRAPTLLSVLLVLLLTGCGSDEPAGPPDVDVVVGGQQVGVRPVQYCLVGEGLRHGRHPDRAESRKVASVLRAVATDLES